MGLSNLFEHFALPAITASGLGALGYSIGSERVLPLGILALAAGGLYRFRWLLTVQQPRNNEQMWGYVSIRQGEQWNVCLTTGQVKTVSGPDVLRVFGAVFSKLRLYSATHSEYLRIEFLDGMSQIVPGPTMVHMDPTVHKDVKVKGAVNLTDHEVLVVYRDDSLEDAASNKDVQGLQSQSVARHVVRGPCLYVPKNATEWTHEFSWHGSVSNDPARNGHKVKDAVKFTKLRVCPEQTYFDVENVRTNDDALVSVKVMIFYRLKNIDMMLKETHDPTADFINSVQSDVIEFVAGKTFEEFKNESAQLNNVSAYKQLTHRAEGIGFEVTKVVFRGYGAPQRLQKMHDDAIERRTKLVLDREIEEQEQQVQDMQLKHEEERLKKRQGMEVETAEHKRKLQRATHEAKQKETAEVQEAQRQHLATLKSSLGLSADQLATYLVAHEQGPPQKLVQIVSSKEASQSNGSSFVIQDTA